MNFKVTQVVGFLFPTFARDNNPSTSNANKTDNSTTTNTAIQELFTPLMNQIANFNMNRLSSSILSSEKKDYLSETSLFSQKRETILIFGGIDPYIRYGIGKNFGIEIYRYKIELNSWESVGELPEPRHHHSCSFLKGRVFLAGGADPRDDEVNGKSVVRDTVWSFEPVNRLWFSERSLSEPRQNFGLITANNCMYAIGGQDRALRSFKSVEKFNSNDRSWSKAAPMRIARSCFASAKYRDRIWVLGGQSGDEILDNLEYYNIETNQWTLIGNVKQCCAATMNVMSDQLFLIGGAAKIVGHNTASASKSDIDVWDIEEMCWKTVAQMNIPRHAHVVGFIGPQLLIIGGVTTNYMRTLRNVECFCTLRRNWIRGVESLQTSLSGHAAVTLPSAVQLKN